MELADDSVNLLTVLSDVQMEHRRLLDGVVVPADRFAVGTQNLQLVRNLRSRPQVARISEPGHEAQRLLLAAPADEDAGVRAAQALR